MAKKQRIVHRNLRTEVCDIDLNSDCVLETMIKLGARLDLETYVSFSFFGTPPDGIEEDAEFLASVPDIILYGPERVQ